MKPVRGLVLVAGLLVAAAAAAHESLPASLLLREVTPAQFDLSWRLPATQGPAPRVWPDLPADCVAVGPQRREAGSGSETWHWRVNCGHAVRQPARIEFEGLAATSIDVLVQASYLDGRVATGVARAASPSVELGGRRAAPAARAYFGLGVEHILGGADHLLFVFALVLRVPGALRLLETVTAFTLAHSLTLAAAALGWLHVPQAPVEAAIALSIFALACELARPAAARGDATRRPWAIAFGFGLLHGLGFAGALAEIGLPEGDIPAALALFNLGVEAGQVAFIAAVVAARALWRRLWQRPPVWVAAVPVHALGSLAAFWWLQRLLVVLAGDGA